MFSILIRGHLLVGSPIMISILVGTFAYWGEFFSLVELLTQVVSRKQFKVDDYLGALLVALKIKIILPFTNYPAVNK